MRRTLSSALAQRPLFFEVTPPAARAPARRGQDHLEKVLGLLKELPRVDLVDVPELVDENHEGRPYYRSGDIRPFASSLGAASGCAVAVNKVVAHLASTPALEAWARETFELGLRNVVLVGGSSRFIPYPGPSVLEADRACLPVLEAGGGRVGNIAIPQRAGEAHRLLAKTRAGASFFTTQILFESRSPIATIREYGGLCRRAGLAPASMILSVAPMIDEGDAEFVRWLGADIPEDAEREILSSEEGAGVSRSVDHALRIWEEVTAGLAESAPDVPVGVNVEEILPRHFDAAAEMLRAFARTLAP
ncbi:MAG TPA: hypothetical protein VGS23_03510 [Thermoplasmata archaeon]|nr:hypothetical protein [Thermoplasmata archaeon]